MNKQTILTFVSGFLVAAFAYQWVDHQSVYNANQSSLSSTSLLDDNRKSRSQLLLQCIAKVCPDRTLTEHDINLESEVSLDPYYFDNLFPISDRVHAKSVQHQLMIKRDLITKDLPKLFENISDEAQVYFNFLDIKHISSKKLFFNYARQNILLDKEKTAEALSVPIESDLIRRLDFYYTEFSVKPLYSVSGPESVRLNFSSEQDLVRAVEQAFNEIEDNKRWFLGQPSLRGLWASISPTDEHIIFIKKTIEENAEDPAALTQLASLYFQTSVLRKIYSDKTYKSLFAFNQQENESQVNLRSIHRLISSDIDYLEDFEEMHVSHKDRYCNSSYMKAISLLPKVSDISELNQQAERTKQIFLSGIKDLISKESHNRILERAERWQVALPQTKESFQASYEQSLLELEQEIRRKSVYDQLRLNQNDVWLIIDAIFNTTDTSRDNYIRLQPNEFCKSISLQPLSDAASFSTNKYSVSVMSLRYPEYGQSIMAHELGHLLYNELESDSTLSVESRAQHVVRLACLAEQHENNSGNLGAEDYADFVGAHSGVSDKNPMCILLGDGRYMPLDSFRLGTDDNRVHSNTIFRLLNFEFQKNRRIPRECLAALPSGEDVSRFNQCQF